MLTATYLVAFLGLIGFLFFLARLVGAFWDTSFRGRGRAHGAVAGRPKSGLVYFSSSADPEPVRVGERAA
ncbi:hypothetical protein EDD29_0162 [Actinocorallia herbida]|uniref:Uncharacterized protein n=1 Tax=Actinocorallia herbida TaxID=58109 RepID=A0A3N1CMY8_9ACTN|nr:hypothetical protein [Actinocorallia herbida]ROO82680.1 hypothetical protein EDD29_0162 [Actinocorallia herbida]